MQKFKIPMMEHSTPRRVLATPMLASEAKEQKIKLAITPKDKNALGMHVKEPVGDISFEYWVPQEMFEKSHVRTDKYTIGEVPMLLLGGAVVTRTNWPKNEMLKWEWDSVTKEGFVRGAHINKVQIYADALGGDKSEIVVSSWAPTLDDILAKDFQTVNIDFKNLKGA